MDNGEGQPRIVSVVVDNESWMVPYAERLNHELTQQGDDARFCRAHGEIRPGYAAFYLGCIRITPPNVLAKNKYNLVVHQSALPQGRGFSPASWQILEGINNIPVRLIEAVAEVDAGDIILKDEIRLRGDELVDEWRAASAEKSIELCRRFMELSEPIPREKQIGEPTYYKRRGRDSNKLDPSQSLGSQFNLLRIVDSEHYPAWFELNGHRYKLKIEKMES